VVVPRARLRQLRPGRRAGAGAAGAVSPGGGAGVDRRDGGRERARPRRDARVRAVHAAGDALALGARLRTAFAAAALIGAISGFAGYLTAFFFDLPVGAAQTTLAAAFTAAAVLVRGAGTAVGRLAPR
jgi:hypothetical protein